MNFSEWEECAMYQPLPIGVENFEKLCEEEYYYVDKTSFDYKYDSGEDEARVKCFSKIKKNGFVFPDSVKMPYSE